MLSSIAKFPFPTGALIVARRSISPIVALSRDTQVVIRNKQNVYGFGQQGAIGDRAPTAQLAVDSSMNLGLRDAGPWFHYVDQSHSCFLEFSTRSAILLPVHPAAGVRKSTGNPVASRRSSRSPAALRDTGTMATCFARRIAR
jgi:hypothetical protein